MKNDEPNTQDIHRRLRMLSSRSGLPGLMPFVGYEKPGILTVQYESCPEDGEQKEKFLKMMRRLGVPEENMLENRWTREGTLEEISEAVRRAVKNTPVQARRLAE